MPVLPVTVSTTLSRPGNRMHRVVRTAGRFVLLFVLTVAAFCLDVHDPELMSVDKLK